VGIPIGVVEALSVQVSNNKGPSAGSGQALGRRKLARELSERQRRIFDLAQDKDVEFGFGASARICAISDERQLQIF
jgi:hypothetical protein